MRDWQTRAECPGCKRTFACSTVSGGTKPFGLFLDCCPSCGHPCPAFTDSGPHWPIRTMRWVEAKKIVEPAHWETRP